MTKGWSEERRRAQAERCRRNKPWTNATGPKTASGKKRSSLNAMKHGLRCREWDDVRELLSLNKRFMRLAIKLKKSEIESFKIKGLRRGHLRNPPTK